MHHEPDGKSVVLLVIYDVDDMVTRPALREVSEDFPWPAWRHVKGNAPEKFEPTRINHIRRDLDEVRVGLNETREALYGEWEKPGQILRRFDGKFREAPQGSRAERSQGGGFK